MDVLTQTGLPAYCIWKKYASCITPPLVVFTLWLRVVSSSHLTVGKKVNMLISQNSEIFVKIFPLHSFQMWTSHYSPIPVAFSVMLFFIYILFFCQSSERKKHQAVANEECVHHINKFIWISKWQKGATVLPLSMPAEYICLCFLHYMFAPISMHSCDYSLIFICVNSRNMSV